MIVYRNLLAPATLNATVERSTPWVPARGARCVMFHWRATSADVPTVAAVPQEGTNLDPLQPYGTVAQSLSGTPAHLLAPIPTTTHALNNAGGVVHSVYPASGATFIQPAAIRMTIKGHGTNPITGLECIAAYVIYDGDAPSPTPAVTV